MSTVEGSDVTVEKELWRDRRSAAIWRSRGSTQFQGACGSVREESTQQLKDCGAGAGQQAVAVEEIAAVGCDEECGVCVSSVARSRRRTSMEALSIRQCGGCSRLSACGRAARCADVTGEGSRALLSACGVAGAGEGPRGSTTAQQLHALDQSERRPSLSIAVHYKDIEDRARRVRASVLNLSSLDSRVLRCVLQACAALQCLCMRIRGPASRQATRPGCSSSTASHVDLP